MKSLPTPEELRGMFRYEPESGLIYWRSGFGGAYSGKVAGSVTTRGYINVNCCGLMLQAHRIVWAMCTGQWPKGEIDHVDHDKGNNRIENLRDVTRSVNHQNRIRARAGSKSGVLGVRLAKGRYFSEIKVGDRYMYLGSFETVEAAHEAYVSAKRRLHEGCTL